MRFSAVVGILAVLVMAQPASAEFYKYRDKNGTIRFTDNLGEVPVAQRGKVTAYTEVQGDPVEKSAAAAPAEAFRDETAPGAVSENAGDASVGAEAAREQKRAVAIDQQARAFNERQEKLRAEYEALRREKAELDKGQKLRVTAAELRIYQKKVNAINDRIKAYREKRVAYEKDVAAHNRLVQGEPEN